MAFYVVSPVPWMFQQHEQQTQQPQQSMQQPMQWQAGPYLNLDDYSDASSDEDDVPKPRQDSQTASKAKSEAAVGCCKAAVEEMAAPTSPADEPAEEPKPAGTGFPWTVDEKSDLAISGIKARGLCRLNSSSDSEPDAELDSRPSSTDPRGGRTRSLLSSSGLSTQLGSDIPSDTDEDSKAAEEDISTCAGASPIATGACPGPFDVATLLSWRSAVRACDRPCELRGYGLEERASAPAKEAAQVLVRPLSMRRAATQPMPGSAGLPCRGDRPAGRGTLPRLCPSENSWSAKQHSDSTEDAKVLRTMRGILNKLTVEKFPRLYEQLLGAGINTPFLVEALIQEVFEKATTQHHFINMYADLCARLHEHLERNPVSDDPGFSFKRSLLNECQTSFERHLVVPAELKDIQDPDERTAAELRYKTRMLGNIRFVGALLTRRMLATKVLLAICHELLRAPTPESLESVAALLTVVGPTFDREEWALRPAFRGIFADIEKIVAQPKCDSRARCLLKDVLDLRAGDWKDRRPKRIEGPTTLSEVARAAAAAAVPTAAAASPTPPCPGAAARRLAAAVLQPPVRRTRTEPAPRPCRAEGAPRLRLCPRKVDPAAPSFDQEAWHDEAAKVFRELRHSFDQVGAAARFAALPVPPSQAQAGEVAWLLAEAAQECSPEVRRLCFEVVAGLFDGPAGGAAPWRAACLAEGLREFMEVGFDDLRVDVPTLPTILAQELVPALKPLVEKDVLRRSILKTICPAESTA